ncbi:MAG: hypothetical protein ABL886_03000, partial [Rhodoglobus sp.]
QDALDEIKKGPRADDPMFQGIREHLVSSHSGEMEPKVLKQLIEKRWSTTMEGVAEDERDLALERCFDERNRSIVAALEEQRRSRSASTRGARWEFKEDRDESPDPIPYKDVASIPIMDLAGLTAPQLQSHYPTKEIVSTLETLCAPYDSDVRSSLKAAGNPAIASGNGIEVLLAVLRFHKRSILKQWGAHLTKTTAAGAVASIAAAAGVAAPRAAAAGAAIDSTDEDVIDLTYDDPRERLKKLPKEVKGSESSATAQAKQRKHPQGRHGFHNYWFCSKPIRDEMDELAQSEADDREYHEWARYWTPKPGAQSPAKDWERILEMNAHDHTRTRAALTHTAQFHEPEYLAMHGGLPALRDTRVPGAPGKNPKEVTKEIASAVQRSDERLKNISLQTLVKAADQELATLRSIGRWTTTATRIEAAQKAASALLKARTAVGRGAKAEKEAADLITKIDLVRARGSTPYAQELIDRLEHDPTIKFTKVAGYFKDIPGSTYIKTQLPNPSKPLAVMAATRAAPMEDDGEEVEEGAEEDDQELDDEERAALSDADDASLGTQSSDEDSRDFAADADQNNGRSGYENDENDDFVDKDDALVDQWDDDGHLLGQQRILTYADLQKSAAQPSPGRVPLNAAARNAQTARTNHRGDGISMDLADMNDLLNGFEDLEREHYANKASSSRKKGGKTQSTTPKKRGSVESEPKAESTAHKKRESVKSEPKSSSKASRRTSSPAGSKIKADGSVRVFHVRAEPKTTSKSKNTAPPRWTPLLKDSWRAKDRNQQDSRDKKPPYLSLGRAVAHLQSDIVGKKDPRLTTRMATDRIELNAEGKHVRDWDGCYDNAHDLQKWIDINFDKPAAGTVLPSPTVQDAVEQLRNLLSDSDSETPESSSEDGLEETWSMSDASDVVYRPPFVNQDFRLDAQAFYCCLETGYCLGRLLETQMMDNWERWDYAFDVQLPLCTVYHYWQKAGVEPDFYFLEGNDPSTPEWQDRLDKHLAEATAFLGKDGPDAPWNELIKQIASWFLDAEVKEERVNGPRATLGNRFIRKSALLPTVPPMRYGVTATRRPEKAKVRRHRALIQRITALKKIPTRQAVRHSLIYPLGSFYQRTVGVAFPPSTRPPAPIEVRARAVKSAEYQPPFPLLEFFSEEEREHLCCPYSGITLRWSVDIQIMRMEPLWTDKELQGSLWRVLRHWQLAGLEPDFDLVSGEDPNTEEWRALLELHHAPALRFLQSEEAEEATRDSIWGRSDVLLETWLARRDADDSKENDSEEPIEVRSRVATMSVETSKGREDRKTITYTTGGKASHALVAWSTRDRRTARECIEDFYEWCKAAEVEPSKWVALFRQSMADRHVKTLIDTVAHWSTDKDSDYMKRVGRTFLRTYGQSPLTKRALEEALQFRRKGPDEPIEDFLDAYYEGASLITNNRGASDLTSVEFNNLIRNCGSNFARHAARWVYMNNNDYDCNISDGDHIKTRADLVARIVGWFKARSAVERQDDFIHAMIEHERTGEASNGDRGFSVDGQRNKVTGQIEHAGVGTMRNDCFRTPTPGPKTQSRWADLKHTVNLSVYGYDNKHLLGKAAAPKPPAPKAASGSKAGADPKRSPEKPRAKRPRDNPHASQRAVKAESEAPAARTDSPPVKKARAATGRPKSPRRPPQLSA